MAPDGRLGLVSNEASGTLSVIDMAAAKKVRDITVGPPLSHPQGIVIDAKGERAYVAMSAMDQVVVVDLKDGEVERTISVGRSVGLGTMPVALSLSPDGTRLFVAESGTDSIAVVRIAGRHAQRRDRLEARRQHPDRRGSTGRRDDGGAGRHEGGPLLRLGAGPRRRTESDRAKPDKPQRPALLGVQPFGADY